MKITVKNIVILFLILIFLSGFIVVSNNSINTLQTLKTSCPNILLRNGNKLSLLNTKNPNVGPLIFNNLEEYQKYYDKEVISGKSCPILYIQEENDTQGKDVYKVYPNPFDIETGLLTMPLSNGIETMVSERNDYINLIEPNGYASYDLKVINAGIFN